MKRVCERREELTTIANGSQGSCAHSAWLHIPVACLHYFHWRIIVPGGKKNTPRSFGQSKALLDIALLKACILKLQFCPKSSLTSRSLIHNLKRKPEVLIPCSLKPAGVLPTFWVGTGSGCKWVYLPKDSFVSNICPLFYSARRFLWRLLLNALFLVKP